MQINAGTDWQKNLKKIDGLTHRALRLKARVIALPETFCARTYSDQFRELAGEVTPQVIRRFQETARQTKTAFLLGSLLELSKEKTRFYNTSYLISEKGKITARYRKIHLFDIFMKKQVKVSESEHIRPGRQIAVGHVWKIRAGLTICYDLRFPELYRRLVRLGSRIIFVPSNFTETTGKAHWEVLLRARAVENQAFIIAPAQVGIHPANGIRSFGTSLVVDPWGNVLARGDRQREGVIMANLRLEFQDWLRRSFPVLKHRALS
ncbi:MAG TPA: carbon-nitrogen hydrolase family protein [bacterium]|nr:carbon-nitrogen hydrolase family protein [bacterium]